MGAAVTHGVPAQSSPILTNGQQHIASFIVIAANGLHFVDELGKRLEAAQLNGKPIAVLHMDANLLVLTEDWFLYYYEMIDSNLVLERQAKLSLGAKAAEWVRMVSLGSGVIALAAGGPSIRIFDFISDDNQELKMPDSEAIRFMALSYNAKRHVVLGGTDSGHMLIWKMGLVRENEQTVKRLFTYQGKLNMGGGIEEIGCGASGELLFARKRNAFNVIQQHQTVSHMMDGLAVYQTNQNRMTVSLMRPTSQVRFNDNFFVDECDA